LHQDSGLVVAMMAAAAYLGDHPAPEDAADWHD
jgi:hypothetical protein